MKTYFYLFFLCLYFTPGLLSAQSPVSTEILGEVQSALKARYGTGENERILKGTSQLAHNWRLSDGKEQEFADFCLHNFMSAETLRENFVRVSDNLSYLEGMLYKVVSRFYEPDHYTDVPKLAADRYLQGILPGADHYAAKFAQYVQLNFPYYTFAEKQQNRDVWDREKWAMVILGDTYACRNDRPFQNPYAEEAALFKDRMDHYFFRVGRITDSQGRFLFPSAASLHCHRGLRDQIKEEYTVSKGRERQAVLYAVIERVTEGKVPLLFFSDTTTRWNPFLDKLYTVKSGKQQEIKDYETENICRYAGILASMKAKMVEDGLYTPPSTAIRRNFDNSSLSFEKTEALIRRFLSDPLLTEVGKIVEKRLGRKLQPYDIWYSGFQDQSAYPAAYLDSLTHSRYPDPETFRKDLPVLLMRMGLTEEAARLVGSRISVRPVVSGGYSSPPSLPEDTALMTTMFGPEGLDYKAFRVSMHELGHCVCGVFCTHDMDYFRLAGVPCDAITEACAELFAYKNAEALDLHPFTPEEKHHLLNLATVWYLLEMGGQTLTEMETWKWMYAHPEANAGELKEAVLSITAEVWNTYFAGIFHGVRNQHVLSVYNHFTTGDMYLHNYFLGNVMMYQFYKAFTPAGLTEGLKKACKEGRTLTDLWMEKAVNSPASTEELLKDAREAVGYFKNRP